ncbi:hypothetical protein CTAYLR_008065 [Chrysophaeum taylorii]|uniref:Oxidoreductase FAD/NAD(P)-binding domain-containing protein n=1 Tax=Chrysophaeum taylorii TaxID=2483200 RepID=A0AAD7UKR3_9STRA|nr:hypothetical protein CTAYLR_008065 [Chrysophaeum taylorii]
MAGHVNEGKEKAPSKIAMMWILVLLAASVASGFHVQRHHAAPRRLRMSWGGDVTWQDVSVLSNDEAAKGMRSITLEVGAETAAGFTVPGQFVQLKLDADAKPGFFAIASPPSNASVFEFLIKETESNEWLTASTPGQALTMSGVAGKGFDVASHFEGDASQVNREYDGFQCMNVMFFATGSGISPIRSTIEAGVAVGLPKPATLYFGVKDADHRPYADKFDTWRTEYNVNVFEVHSQPLDGWDGATGYVQDALKINGVPVPRNTGACICGQKDMFLAVKDILLDAGVFEGRILTNF